ncbi:MAG: hypothetical protein SFY81_08230 [Verrucomicrobiota bacterium]|nr:hypothetical protein [Verrucomicrobiota bacterium]
MAIDLEIISPTDKPALIAVSSPEVRDFNRTVLQELGFKVHTATDHQEFIKRFTSIQYQVVIISELFAATSLSENESLSYMQIAPMNLRRHASVIMIGDSFETLNPMQAFVQSVHAVVNPMDLPSMPQIIQRVVSDNNLFLNVYRDTQIRISQGK